MEQMISIGTLVKVVFFSIIGFFAMCGIILMWSKRHIKERSIEDFSGYLGAIAVASAFIAIAYHLVCDFYHLVVSISKMLLATNPVYVFTWLGIWTVLGTLILISKYVEARKRFKDVEKKVGKEVIDKFKEDERKYRENK